MEPCILAAVCLAIHTQWQKIERRNSTAKQGRGANSKGAKTAPYGCKGPVIHAARTVGNRMTGGVPHSNHIKTAVVQTTAVFIWSGISGFIQRFWRCFDIPLFDCAQRYRRECSPCRCSYCWLHRTGRWASPLRLAHQTPQGPQHKPPG